MFKRVTGLGAEPKPDRATEDDLRHEIASMESIHKANMRPFYEALAKIEAAKAPVRIDAMNPAFAAPYGPLPTFTYAEIKEALGAAMHSYLRICRKGGMPETEGSKVHNHLAALSSDMYLGLELALRVKEREKS